MRDPGYPGFWPLVRSDLESYLQERIGGSPFAMWLRYWKVAYLHPGAIALLANRVGYFLRHGNPGPFARVLFRLWLFRLRISSSKFAGSWISSDAKIGKGCRHMHLGGVIVNGSVEVGDYCDLWQGVNLIADQTLAAPKIGNWVTLGAKCTVVGNVEIGDFAVIGTGAVVTKNVPRGAVVVGVPGRVARLIDPGERPPHLPERNNVDDAEYRSYL
jgi:serine O-acetyltransferase